MACGGFGEAALLGKSLILVAPSGAVWCGFGALTLASAAGAAVPPGAISIAAFLAVAVSLGLAGRSVARIWRGPPLVGFPKEGAAPCDPVEAEAIRAAAQVRGTLGGAGHVKRARLLFPALAWAAAAAFAAGFVDPGAEARLWALAVLVPFAVLSASLRASPFHYREAMEGWLVVYPGAARGWLLPGCEARRDRAPTCGAVPSGESDREVAWGNTPTAGGTAPQADAEAGR
jgi:hypothetical protein